jgi:hypothetical protein
VRKPSGGDVDRGGGEVDPDGHDVPPGMQQPERIASAAPRSATAPRVWR